MQLKPLLITLGLVSFTAQAQLDPNRASIGIIGNFAQSSFPEETNAGSEFVSSSDFSSGIALGLSHDVDTGLGIHSGVSILNRQVTWGSDTLNYTQDYWMLRVPVQAQFHFTKLVSLGAGAYFGTPISDTSNKVNFGDEADLNFNTDTQAEAELGGVVSARIHVPLENNSSIFVETQYLRGFTDLANNDDVQSFTNDFSSKVGLAVLL